MIESALLTLLLALGSVALLLLNGFFVLAEFAIVKVRPSRVEELQAAGVAHSDQLARIQQRLDEYLSVCQIGITLASVALGMVSERLAVMLASAPGEPSSPQTLVRLAVASGISYALVSGAHIVLGELVPKSIAIRLADSAALRCAPLLRFFYGLFFPALWLLTRLANAVLRLLGLGQPAIEERHSEEELRIILDRSQARGLLSFRRLLLMENIFNFGDLTVRDAMLSRAAVHCLDASRPWQDNLATVRAVRGLRFPVLQHPAQPPVGVVHIRDLLLAASAPAGSASTTVIPTEASAPPRPTAPPLHTLVRPVLHVNETLPLETLLAEMQRRRIHAAVVSDSAGRWSGFITIEDIIEEIVGTLGDEADDPKASRLSDAINLERIHLDIAAASPLQAVRVALERLGPDALGPPNNDILHAIAARERLAATYLGHGIAMPHARIAGLHQPVVLVLRSPDGVNYEGHHKKAHLLFVLLTPAGQPRIHQRLQRVIAALFHDSAYVKERLLNATSPEETLQIIRTGEQMVRD